MKRIWIAALALVVAGAGYALYLMNAAGEFRTIADLHPSDCRPVPGVDGPEDVEWHPSEPFALISSFDRRAASEGRPRPGAIFRIPLDRPAEPVNLTPDAGIHFRPHGISMHVGGDGRTTLFVVNHPGETRFGAPPEPLEGPAHTIEVFDLVGGRLVHRRQLADPLLVGPNDIVAVDHERFYVTNDHGTRPGLMRKVEDYLRLPWADVVYYDGREFRRVAEGLSYANGIQLSPDGERVWVTEVTRSRLAEYRRDPGTGSLEEIRRFGLGFGADNINLDRATGALWIGGHAKLLTFARHASDASVDAPSQVIRVDMADDAVDLHTVFLDDGDLLSGASAAAYRDGTLLIGAVFSPHALLCRGID